MDNDWEGEQLLTTHNYYNIRFMNGITFILQPTQMSDYKLC